MMEDSSELIRFLYAPEAFDTCLFEHPNTIRETKIKGCYGISPEGRIWENLADRIMKVIKDVSVDVGSQNYPLDEALLVAAKVECLVSYEQGKDILNLWNDLKVQNFDINAEEISTLHGHLDLYVKKHCNHFRFSITQTEVFLKFSIGPEQPDKKVKIGEIDSEGQVSIDSNWDIRPAIILGETVCEEIATAIQELTDTCLKKTWSHFFSKLRRQWSWPKNVAN